MSSAQSRSSGLLPGWKALATREREYVNEEWERLKNKRMALLEKAAAEQNGNDRVSEVTQERLKRAFIKAMTLHNHRRAKDQLSTTHKLSGSILEWRRLKELGLEYAELQPPNADHPLGYDAWKDFQRVWGKAEDTYSPSSNSSSASLPASEDHEDEEETTSFTVFGPAGKKPVPFVDPFWKRAAEQERKYAEQVWEEELRNRKSLLLKADQERIWDGQVSEVTKEELRKSFITSVGIHNHRRAKDQKDPVYKLSGSVLEKLRLKQLAKEYEKLQSSDFGHPLGPGSWKEFRGRWGTAKDAVDRTSVSSLAAATSGITGTEEEGSQSSNPKVRSCSITGFSKTNADTGEGSSVDRIRLPSQFSFGQWLAKESE